MGEEKRRTFPGETEPRAIYELNDEDLRARAIRVNLAEIRYDPDRDQYHGRLEFELVDSEGRQIVAMGEASVLEGSTVTLCELNRCLWITID